MLPYRDNIKSGRTPVVTWLIIATCIFVHVADLLSHHALRDTWAFVARDLLAPGAWLQRGPLVVLGSLFVSQFLHGGLLHLGSNMLFLYVFGDNVEDRMGHIKYLVFYLLCGTLAALAEAVLTAFPDRPMIGASGAIAGVLGAYFILFKGAWVRSVMLLFIFPVFVDIPAIFFIGLWIIFQFVFSMGYLVPTTGGGPQAAYFAHIGGFVAGMLLQRSFVMPLRRPPPRYRVLRLDLE